MLETKHWQFKTKLRYWDNNYKSAQRKFKNKQQVSKEV